MTLTALLWFSRSYAGEQLYTCGMHPQVIKKEPGNCPICGMKLTPIHGNAGKVGPAKKPTGERKIKYYKSTMTPGEVKPGPGKDAMGMDLVPVYEEDAATTENTIQVDAVTRQRMNIRTAVVEHGPVRREFRTVGTITYNEEGLRDITTKYEGWIEKLLVNATWSSVEKDAPLFEMYSPDLYNAQLNYLVALRTEGDEGGPLSRATLARLQLFDVPSGWIDEVKKTGQANRTFVFRAPTDGVVIEKMAVVGQMMKPGERIYRLADLSSVWVQAQVYEKDLPFVRAGQPVTVHTTYGTDRSFEGQVAMLLPQVQEETRSAVARIVLPNPDRYLRPGMFVDVNFTAQLADEAVLVPDMAVLRSGERNTVFVALEEGAFEPREVTLGARSSGNFYEVLSGLKVGETVVTSGQFMLDSESQLREAIQKMLKAAPSVGEAPGHAALPVAPEAKTASGRPVSPENAKLPDLVLAAADASGALGKDDLAAYQAIVPKLEEALAAYRTSASPKADASLGSVKAGSLATGSLEEARAYFAAFSTAVADLARGPGLHRQLGLHIFECSMAPGGTARWVQRSAQKRNPFFGSEMSSCGTELDPPSTGTSLPQPRAGRIQLPPGHPPIPEVSLVDYLRSEAVALQAKPTASEQACGTCGMTAAAMAAGAPCESDHGTAGSPQTRAGS